jgi:hypothetical protein
MRFVTENHSISEFYSPTFWLPVKTRYLGDQLLPIRHVFGEVIMLKQTIFHIPGNWATKKEGEKHPKSFYTLGMVTPNHTKAQSRPVGYLGRQHGILVG